MIFGEGKAEVLSGSEEAVGSGQLAVGSWHFLKSWELGPDCLMRVLRVVW